VSTYVPGAGGTLPWFLGRERRARAAQGAGCGVWQHCECVRFDAGAAGAAARFLCEVCRLGRADPFWRPVNLALAAPARLQHAPGRPVRPGGASDEWVSHVRRDFSLPHALVDSLRATQDCQLQARAPCVPARARPRALCARPRPVCPPAPCAPARAAAHL